uniref:Metallo-beta-lactamase domain-containing protein n=1 Tax=Amorphochlora amoebiformis TaxID=1561963 RepID=A0A6T6VLK9_9EUKA
MFTELANYGIQKIIPDLTLISFFKENIESIIITHGHEDHIGALSWVLPIFKNKTKLFVSSFVYNIIIKRLLKNLNSRSLDISIFNANKKFQFGPFECQTFRVTHSIPDCYGFVLKSPYGNILHTGDWKMDEAPLDGEILDKELLQEISKEGVLLFFSDSTNAMSPGRTLSERNIYDSITNIITNPSISGRIITTQFASNVYRLYSIKKSSELTNRKICFLGASLNSYLEAAYLDGRAPFNPSELIEDDTDLDKYDNNSLLIVTTGSQGEPNSTLNLSSLDVSSKLSLKSSDTILYSAKIIPGNEKRVTKMLNRLSSHGCDIIYGNNKHIHTSGHAYEEELKEILKIVKPKVFIPVHGEVMSLYSHGKMALRECGVSKVAIIRNGQLLKVTRSPESSYIMTNHILGECRISNFYQFGNNLVSTYEELSINERIRISSSGVIIISIEFWKKIIDKNTDFKFYSKIKITSKGLWTDRGKLNSILKKIINGIFIKSRPVISVASLEQIIQETIAYMCFKINYQIPEICIVLNEFSK